MTIILYQIICIDHSGVASSSLSVDWPLEHYNNLHPLYLITLKSYELIILFIYFFAIYHKTKQAATPIPRRITSFKNVFEIKVYQSLIENDYYNFYVFKVNSLG